jgi:hypothetical protein
MSTKENWDDESSDEEELNEKFEEAQLVEKTEAQLRGKECHSNDPLDQEPAEEPEPIDEEAHPDDEWDDDDYDDDYDDEVDKKLGRYVSCR